jgi:hypothetical protein
MMMKPFFMLPGEPFEFQFYEYRWMDKWAKGVVLIIVSKVCEGAEERTLARIMDANGIRLCT